MCFMMSVYMGLQVSSDLTCVCAAEERLVVVAPTEA